jgi:hypothetical protein
MLGRRPVYNARSFRMEEIIIIVIIIIFMKV